MQLRLGIHQRAYSRPVPLLDLTDQPVNTDIAFPLLLRDLMLSLQPIEESAVAFRRILIFLRKSLKILLQL